MQAWYAAEGYFWSKTISKITFTCIMWHLTCVNEDEKKAPRKHASLCHHRIPLQPVSELMDGSFLGLLGSSVQHLVGGGLLLHFETTELPYLHWRQDAGRWCARTGFNEGQQRGLQSTGKMWTEILSHFSWLASPTSTHISPGSKATHNSP